MKVCTLDSNPVVAEGVVSWIILFSETPLCRVFYDIDGTTLGIQLPYSIRLVILALLLRTPPAIIRAVEPIVIPLKSLGDRKLINPSSKCFLTARSTATLCTTIKELKKHFNRIDVLVVRKSNVRIKDYYKYVTKDLYTKGIPVKKVIIYG